MCATGQPTQSRAKGRRSHTGVTSREDVEWLGLEAVHALLHDGAAVLWRKAERQGEPGGGGARRGWSQHGGGASMGAEPGGAGAGASMGAGPAAIAPPCPGDLSLIGNLPSIDPHLVMPASYNPITQQSGALRGAFAPA